jgi:hypothetical protein
LLLSLGRSLEGVLLCSLEDEELEELCEGVGGFCLGGGAWDLEVLEALGFLDLCVWVETSGASVLTGVVTGVLGFLPFWDGGDA